MARRILSIQSALKGALTVFAVGLAGCLAAEHPSAVGKAPPAVAAVSEAPRAPAGSSAAGSKADAPAPVPSVAIAFENVLEAAIHSIAFGEKRMAALGANAAWMDEGSGWKKMPDLPVDASGSRIFFGRDDKPRIMGGDSGEYVYLRFRGGIWKRGDEEIAGLASAPRSPLYGVLGHADPEVVCKLGGGCILKRRSGWTLFEPPAVGGPPRLELCGADAYAFERSSVWKVTSDGFVMLPGKPTFSRADGLWATASDAVWVVDHDADTVHRHDGKEWSSGPTVIDGPRAVWASGPNDVWIAGDGGAARFDGSAWSRIQGLPPGLITVFGRSASDVWLAGEPGLFRVNEASPPRASLK